MDCPLAELYYLTKCDALFASVTLSFTTLHSIFTSFLSRSTAFKNVQNKRCRKKNVLFQPFVLDRSILKTHDFHVFKNQQPTCFYFSRFFGIFWKNYVHVGILKFFYKTLKSFFFFRTKRKKPPAIFLLILRT